ncbi:hypothetical protein EDM57_04385 [Brevibacillus gelatini]|uniref:Uncharacterized protein n=1 Tax=Brevibacillus gelatini TaxID=1655277 RepID=A0A3M8B7H0_9BACL|nr:hypothetical protein [Brevibacillus gelatini]RNB59386.1 hypothetical protein EDM57_04385 [Brevibacillus gelatini]
MTKDVPNVEDAKEWILNILKCVKDIDLFQAYNLSVRDFERGYEGKELRKALKSLEKAYEELKGQY